MDEQKPKVAVAATEARWSVL